MKIWTRKILLKFGSHPRLDPDSGIFEGGIFLQFGSHLWCVVCLWKSYHRCICVPQGSVLGPSTFRLYTADLASSSSSRKAPLNFGSHPNSPWQRSALLECSRLWTYIIRLSWCAGSVRRAAGKRRVVSKCVSLWETSAHGECTGSQGSR